MHKHWLIFASLTLTLWQSAPALARCACLDTPDEAAQRAREEEALRRLPSQAEVELARQFAQQQINQDADAHYLQAAKLAESEASGDGGSAASAAMLHHSIDVEREAAAFLSGTGKLGDSAEIREHALAHALTLGTVDDRQVEFRGLAQAFESAGNHGKAAEYYQKLADLLSATHGRYNSQTTAAVRDYRRNLAQAKRSTN